MAIKKVTVGSRVYYADNVQDVLFTKTEMKKARDRYYKKKSQVQKKK